MEWQWAAAIYLVILLVLLVGGMWIAFALGIVGVIGLLLINPRLLQGIAGIAWNNTNSFTLTAIPLFIFMGAMVMNSGLSGRFYQGLSTWLDRVPGSLAHSNIAACTVFAAISGSSVATAAAIGSVAIPEMDKRGYDGRITYGSLAAGGTLGILIPPSIPFIVYASMTNTSVGKLFIAGIIPGLLLSSLFVAYLASRTALNPGLVPREERRSSLKERVLALGDFLPMVGLIVLVLGSIYGGFATPTEAAALGAVGAVVLSIAYGRFDFAAMRRSLDETVKTTSMVVFIVVGAQIMSFAMVSAKIPRSTVAAIDALQLSPLAVFAAIAIMYLILGCLVDSLSMMFLTLPVVFPIVSALGYDPIWFGVVLVVLLEVGLITPPVGMNLFVIQGLTGGKPLGKVIEGATPYVVLMLLLIIALVAFPGLALWLPSQMN